MLLEQDLSVLLLNAANTNRQAWRQPRRLLVPADDKTLLMRLLRQLKQAYLAQGNVQNALWALEQSLLLAPELASGFRERGHLYELLDCRYAAAMDYTHYLKLLPDASDAANLRQRLPELLRTQVTLH